MVVVEILLIIYYYLLSIRYKQYNYTNCTQMLADIIQNPLYITATCVLYTKHYITNCCTGYLITGTSGPGVGRNEGIPLCIHFEMLHKCSQAHLFAMIIILNWCFFWWQLKSYIEKGVMLICFKRSIILLYIQGCRARYHVTFLNVGTRVMLYCASVLFMASLHPYYICRNFTDF